MDEKATDVFRNFTQIIFMISETGFISGSYLFCALCIFGFVVQETGSVLGERCPFTPGPRDLPS